MQRQTSLQQLRGQNKMVKQKDLKISPEDTFNLDELSDSDETVGNKGYLEPQE